MCGIGGVINLSKNTSKLKFKNISILKKLISRRGPDNNGNWISKEKDVVLTIQRLATQDKRIIANQPCYSTDKTIVAIMNGEIYNQIKLRKFLTEKGYKFISYNDTEVVANAYHYWGIKFLNKIQGQFALVVYDLNKKKGIIARDEHGICPLFFLKDNKKIMFSSTADSIFYQSNIKLKINKKALSEYIVGGCALEGRTIYKNIKYLEPGNYLEFTSSLKIKEKRFVNVTDFLNYDTSSLKSKDGYINKIYNTLKNNVKYSIHGDKTVGIYLSSGLDSALILALYRYLYPNSKIKTFTASFENIKNKKLTGEQNEVKKICNYFNASNKIVRVKSKDLIKSLGEFSQPPCDILEATYTALAKEAKKSNVEVILSGEGSDEMFFGYDHNLALISYFKKEFKFLNKKFKFRNKLINNSAKKKFNKIEDLFLFGGANIDLDKNRKEIFNNSITKTDSLKKTISKMIKKYNFKNPIDVDKIIVLLDYHIKLPELLLRRADYHGMHEGVEMRFPFLNKNLKDLLYATPLKYKIDKSLIAKNLLRKVASKLIPNHLMFEKLPFGVPGVTNEYFKKSQIKFKEAAFKNIFNSNFKHMKKTVLYGLHSRLKFFKKDFLKKLIKKQENNKNCKFDTTLWRIWSFATWYNNKVKN